MNYCCSYPDRVFKDYFRTTKSQFRKLVEDLNPFLMRPDGAGRIGFSTDIKVGISLMVLSRGESFRGLETFGVSKTAGHDIFVRFLRAVKEAYPTTISMPINAEIGKGYAVFVDKIGNRAKYFPNVIGAVDGIHFKVRPPKGLAAPWINRTGFASLNMQALVDGNCKFIHLSIGAPGRVHDASVFRASSVLDFLPENCVILGEPIFYHFHCGTTLSLPVLL